MSITKSQNARVMSEEAIQYLCKCINLVNSLPTSVIDNLHLADNLTFSSTKIDSLLTILKEDCNKYTDSIVANLSRLELKVVTDEADMIEHNKLYLIKKAGETSYSQYVIVTNDSGVDEKILLGTCDISMTDYLKIADADSTYCKITDFNTLKTEVDKVKTKVGTDTLNTTSQDLSGGVNELKTDLTTHTSDTDIHITTAERDKWNKVDNKVDKTDIVSVLDSTVTNNQLVDGKTLVDKFNSIEDNFSLRYDFDNIRHKRAIDRKLAIKTVIDKFKRAGASTIAIDYYEKHTIFIIRYNQGYYYTYIMTSYFSKVFILEYSVYSTDMILWVEDESGELYIRGTIPITENVIRFVKPFTTNKDKYKLYDGQYTIDENTKTCTLTVSIDCLSPASEAIDVGSLNTLNFKVPSSPRTFDLKAEDDSTNIMRFYLGSMNCQVWLGTARKRYTGTVTYTIK